LGRPFTFFKFRTMHSNCDVEIHKAYVKKLINGDHEDINHGTEKDPMFKIVSDNRVTLIGKWLRRTSLDEIPQLFNVIKGYMSLIGPRPPLPYEVEVYKTGIISVLWEVKPGITGLWQVSGRNRTTFDEMVKFDIQYAENASLLLDIKIVFKTAAAMSVLEGC
jgi:lipopolysaccharide/colanic/teichoic acid biosynthesis glycosyltransferase